MSTWTYVKAALLGLGLAPATALLIGAIASFTLN